jgi:hypothetical protein
VLSHEEFWKLPEGERPATRECHVSFWSWDRRLHTQHLLAPDKEHAVAWATPMFAWATFPELKDEIMASVKRIEVKWLDTGERIVERDDA